MKLGADRFDLLNAKQSLDQGRRVIFGAPGLTNDQIVSIEEQLGVRLPEDFAYLLQNIQDPSRVLFPWAEFEKQEYDKSIDGVWRGIEFDIRHNVVWLGRWGVRPASLMTALDIAKEDFRTWPKLLPIYAHRFLAAEPCRIGNPVFSIHQTDIIYYGTDLPNYLLAEFVSTDHAPRTFEGVRRVGIWSDFAEGLIP